MSILRPSLRFTLLAIHLGIGLGLGPFLRHQDQPRWRVIRWWHGRVLRVLGIRLRVTGEPAGESTLIAANHISWLDIPVIGSQAPAAFLSKAEIRQWPAIGWLAERVDTLFIRRGRGASSAVQAISESLNQGGCVAFFPEATTTPGDELRRFHPRLFQAAIDAGARVQPAVIRFPGNGGTDPRATFIGDDTFMQSLRRVLRAPRLEAEIHFLDPIPAESVASRDEQATLAHQRIEAVSRGKGGVG